MQRAKNKIQPKRPDRRGHENSVGPFKSRFSRSGLEPDEIRPRFFLEAANDEMRPKWPPERDKKRFGPEMEQSLRSHFRHCAHSLRFERRPRFCWLEEWVHIREDPDNSDDASLSSEFGWIESESERRRSKLSNEPRRDAFEEDL